MIRTLFINSGILGHRAVANLVRETVELMPSVDGTHINLSDDLTLPDRIVRRLLCARLAPQRGAAANLDLARWRQELHAGLLASRRIRRAERPRPFDVLHFHTQATAYASLHRMKRTPTIVSIDATQHLASLETTSSIGRFTYTPNIVHDGHVFRAAGAIVATSRWAADDLASIYPDCAAKVRVMPYPVKVGLFTQDWLCERGSRSRSTAPPPVRVLFVGGDFPRKGGHELLTAWRQGGFADRAVLELVTDWAIGPGELPPGVQLVRGVTPYTPVWFDLWRRTDLFVMPTRHEAFGMVYQEAAAAGVPAIATRINAIPEIVEDGRTGLLVAPGQTAALIESLRTLIDSADLRQQMGQAARRRIEAIGSPQAYAAGLERLIQQLVRTHAPQPS